MKNRITYYTLGGILCLLAAVFLIVALTHPELSFPWPNWVSCTMYGLYAIYTVLVFLMPRFKGASLTACAILPVQFIALSFIVLSIGSHFSTGETNWYLPIGLGLTCVANFTNLAIQKKKEKLIMLKIEHLTKKYGDKKAVDDLCLHIHPGEIYGFIGHNGAGKTTTLKSIVGILAFDEGVITIDGVSIKENPLKCKKMLAYIPDNPDLYDYMTGIKYLNFIADIFDISSEVRKERIEKYAAAFELTNDLAQPISAYSHGMKQKLAIIAAWIHSPKLILMDEPFVGLDPKASHILKEMMHEHCENGGAIFFSTHVLEVAEKLCDKVAIIKSGKLIKSGTMEEVKGDESLEEVFLELGESEA